MKYKRIILKLSGEVFSEGGPRLSSSAGSVCREIKEISAKGVGVGVVIGGGNILRGAHLAGEGVIPRAEADKMGMLATCINGVWLREELASEKVDALLMGSLPVQGIVEAFDRKKAMDELSRGRVIVFCGGTGNPFFSTDTAAVLRALEVGADVLMKGTKVDGVYSADPVKDRSATKFDKLTYIEVIKMRLKVMDLTSVSMCMEHNLPIVVFDILKPGNLRKAALGDKLGTVIYG